VTKANDIKAGLWAVIALAALGVAFVLPTQAVAGECDEASSDPTAAQYCPPTEVTPPPEEAPVIEEESSSVESVQTESVPAPEPAPAPAPEASASGSLPFTGLDLAALAAVATALTAAGFALYRLSGTGSGSR
jgi:hypothetical protein